MSKQILKSKTKTSKHESELQKWFKSWKTEISKHKYLLLASFIMLAIAGVICFFASTYVDKIQAIPSSDLILDHIPTINLNIFYVYGFMLVLITAIIYSILFHVKKFHEITFLFGMLILVRSFFITLTHLGVPNDARIITEAPSLFQLMSFQNDLFFSGHTAMSFMAFLIFRKEAIKTFFLISTIILSATVLLMHVHYSIDVFSAFFITYGVYKFGEWFISKGYLQTKPRVTNI
jgi:hypothetical protein